jgi:chromosome partitioning protein
MSLMTLSILQSVHLLEKDGELWPRSRISADARPIEAARKTRFSNSVSTGRNGPEGLRVMGIVYAVVNQKGGVGKTTTAVNLATYMAMAGSKVLLVDLDPQGNATSGFGIDRNAVASSTYDVLVEGKPVIEAVIRTKVENLAVIPATLDLAGADLELISKISRETFLRQALEPARTYFDIIIIDGPPSLGLLTLNALVAADGVILPIQTEFYALEGISQLLKTIDLVKRQLNPSLYVAKVILTMYDSRMRLAQQVEAEVKQFFQDKVSPTIIPRNVRLSEAPSHGVPVALYDPRSRGALAYQKIAMEVLKNGKEGTR